MSWVRIWIHVVFSTKNREPYFNTANLRMKVFQHIKQNAITKNIYLDCINGYQEHAHCLICLGKEQSVSKVVQQIKGESASWINEQNLTGSKFVWQDDYWAVSVSETHLEAVRNYIHRQEEHHKLKPFEEEMDKFAGKYGWKPFTEVNGIKGNR